MTTLTSFSLLIQKYLLLRVDVVLFGHLFSTRYSANFGLNRSCKEWSLKKKRSAEPGQKYLRRLLSNEALSKEDISVLEIMKHCLDLIEEYPHLLLKEAKKEKWSRLLELLFSNVKNVRIKSGESVPILSTTNKVQLYPDESNIIRFKIDVRIVLGIGDEEFDFVAMEVAKDDHDTKVIEDSSKLLRETKDDLNNLIEILSGGYNEQIFTWSLQISGSNCYMSNSHLACNGLYVSIPQHTVDLPPIAATEPLLQLRKTLEFLLSFKNSIEDNFGRLKQTFDNDINLWTRDTWYTPHRNNRSASAIPSHLFGLMPFLEKILLLANDEDNQVEANNSTIQDNGDACGYVKTSSG